MSDIENVKTKLGITDLVSRYVDLKPAGSNMKGLCPFHQEKSPSFMVNPSLQIFKCFGCGKGGDIFNFIQEMDRVEFPEALKIAADMAGVELTGKYNTQDKELEKKKERMYKANEIAAKFFYHLLTNHKIGKKALEYSLEKRQLTFEELKKFQYGYAPDGYENLKGFMLKKSFTEEELVEVGLLIERDGSVIDKFRNRLMQPVFDLKGNVVAFSGRYLGTFEGAPKYLNSPETLIYKKNELLYGLYQGKEAIRRSKFAIIVEGNIDIASSHRAGIENIVAPLGTSFTANQARLLKRFCDQIYFAFDTDNAGVNAVVRGLKIAEDIGIQHKVIDLGEYGDVDDLIRDDKNKWPKAIDNAVDTMDYLKKVFSKDLDLGTVDGKNNFKKSILPPLKSLKDDVQKSHYIKDISMLLELPQDSLQDEVDNSTMVRLIEEKDDPVLAKPSEEQNAKEVYFLALLVQANLFKELRLKPSDLSSASAKEILEALVSNKAPLEKVDILSENSAKIYGEITMMDIPKNSKEEFEKIQNRIYRGSLQSQIMKVRADMAKDPESIKPVEKLKELLEELNSID